MWADENVDKRKMWTHENVDKTKMWTIFCPHFCFVCPHFLVLLSTFSFRICGQFFFGNVSNDLLSTFSFPKCGQQTARKRKCGQKWCCPQNLLSTFSVLVVHTFFCVKIPAFRQRARVQTRQAGCLAVQLFCWLDGRLVGWQASWLSGLAVWPCSRTV